MYTVKKTTVTKLNLNELRARDGHIINEDGEILNLPILFENAFGADCFSISSKLQIDDQFNVDGEELMEDE